MFEVKNNSEYAEMMKAFKDNNVTTSEELAGQIRVGQGGFNEGDHIEWPDKLEFLNITIGDSKKPAQALLCKITDKDGGIRYSTFFPNSLNKRIFEIKVDDAGNWVKTVPAKLIQPEGQAAKDYQGKANMKADEVFKKMVAEHPDGIKVTKVRQVNIRVYQSEDTTVTNQYTFEYA